MKKVVLSLGGSVLVPSLEENNIRHYAAVLKELADNYQIYVVVGGGGEARRYIGVAREQGVDEATADELGIMVTRINASLLSWTLGDAAYPCVPENQTQAKCFGETGKIVVMGGVTPAQTTDAVSAVLAERVGANLLINATSVDGIYSADPKKNPAAVRYDALTPDRLLEIVMNDRMDAGSNTVVDLVASKVVQRSGIPLLVLDGRDPDNIKSALTGGVYKGTIVSKSQKNPLPL